MVLVGKPDGKRPQGRPRLRRQYNIKADLQERKRGGKDRDSWRALMNAVINLRVP
jgi:hypothetical protein